MIMAIEHSGIAISTDSIKTKLLDMACDVGNSGSAFASKDVNTGLHSNKKTVGSKIKDLKDVKCYGCQEMGHFRSRCPKSKSKYVKENKNVFRHQSNAFSAVFLSGSFSKNDWYVDSGASVHLTANKDWLSEISTKTNMKEIMVANQTKVQVTCSGNVQLETVVLQRRHDITVKDVLCVPELTTNLLSVSQLIQNGNLVKFESHCCKIYNKQNVLAQQI